MTTVTDILEAAARLSADELCQLEEGILRLQRRAKALTLEVGRRDFRLSRLSDNELFDRARHSIATQEDLGFQIQLHLFRRSRGLPEPDFARVDAILTHLTGPSGQRFDVSKGSFCFPFLVEVSGGQREVAYLLEVYNCRDSIYYPFRKLVSPGDARLKLQTYHAPIDAELSRDEMNLFVLLFQDYLLRMIQEVGEEKLRPFVRGVRASSIVYGLWKGEFFEEEHDNEEAWSAALERYRKRIAKESNPNRATPQK